MRSCATTTKAWCTWDAAEGRFEAEDAAKTLEEVLKNTNLPLIVTGSGNVAKDREVIPALAEVAKGENVLLGIADKDNYKTLAAAALAGGHSLIAESPLDINLAK